MALSDLTCLLENKGTALLWLHCAAWGRSRSSGEDSINFSNLSARGSLALGKQDSVTHTCLILQCIWRRYFLWLLGCSLKTFYLCFQLDLPYSASYFFFLYWSTSFSSCTVLCTDTLQSYIDKVLPISPSTNVFVFRNFDAHHMD